MDQQIEAQKAINLKFTGSDIGQWEVFVQESTSHYRRKGFGKVRTAHLSAMKSSTTAMWWVDCGKRGDFCGRTGSGPGRCPCDLSAHRFHRYGNGFGTNLEVLDATCAVTSMLRPNVMPRKFIILLIGHREHVEVEGTFGEAPDRIIIVGTVEEAENLEPPSSRIAYLTQTTLSWWYCRHHQSAAPTFPGNWGPAKDDICCATQNDRMLSNRFPKKSIWSSLSELKTARTWDRSRRKPWDPCSSYSIFSELQTCWKNAIKSVSPLEHRLGRYRSGDCRQTSRWNPGCRVRELKLTEKG